MNVTEQNITNYLDMDELIDKSSEVLSRTLFRAMERPDNTERVMRLFERKGFNINIRKEGDEHNTPLLQRAISNSQNIEVIQCILERGGDVNEKDANGNTAAHVAVEFRQLKTLSLLLEEGADVNAQCTFLGNTPLHRVADEYDDVGKDEEKIINLLLQHGADSYAENKSHISPVEMLASNDDADSQKITKLLQAHILFENPNAKKPDEMTPENSVQWDAFRTELERMKEFYFKNESSIEDSSLYDICKKKNLDLVSIRCNKDNIMGQLEEQEKAKQFPLYGARIRDNLEKGFEIKEVKKTKKAENRLKKSLLFNLPHQEESVDLSVSKLSLSGRVPSSSRLSS